MVNKPEEKSVESSEFKDSPAWLTEEVFYEFLAKDFPNYEKVKKFHVTPAVANGENYMTVLLRVAIEVAMPDAAIKSTSYMVKIKPAVETLQIMINEWQIFMKELTTYTKYIPIFEKYYEQQGVNLKFGPQILVPQRSNAIDEEFVILEDLRLKGFRNAVRQLGLDMLHTKAVLRKLAQFHAASARYAESEEPFPTMYDKCLSCVEDRFVDHRLKHGKLFRDNMHLYGNVEHLKEKLKKFAEEHVDPFQLKSERCPTEFNVLNHGDLWLNNIMFQYADDGSLTQTYFIDFQMSRYGSPAQDLIYFILSSTQLDIKVKHFDYLIAYYHKHLIKSLQLIKFEGKLPKLRDLHIALYKHDNWAYTTISMLMPVVICESRDDANLENMLGEKGDEFRRSMYTNNNYAMNMQLLLPWLDARGAFDL